MGDTKKAHIQKLCKSFLKESPKCSMVGEKNGIHYKIGDHDPRGKIVMAQQQKGKSLFIKFSIFLNKAENLNLPLSESQIHELVA